MKQLLRFYSTAFILIVFGLTTIDGFLEQQRLDSGIGSRIDGGFRNRRLQASDKTRGLEDLTRRFVPDNQQRYFERTLRQAENRRNNDVRDRRNLREFENRDTVNLRGYRDDDNKRSRESRVIVDSRRYSRTERDRLSRDTQRETSRISGGDAEVRLSRRERDDSSVSRERALTRRVRDIRDSEIRTSRRDNMERQRDSSLSRERDSRRIFDQIRTSRRDNMERQRDSLLSRERDNRRDNMERQRDSLLSRQRDSRRVIDQIRTIRRDNIERQRDSSLSRERDNRRDNLERQRTSLLSRERDFRRVVDQIRTSRRDNMELHRDSSLSRHRDSSRVLSRFAPALTTTRETETRTSTTERLTRATPFQDRNIRQHRDEKNTRNREELETRSSRDQTLLTREVQQFRQQRSDTRQLTRSDATRNIVTQKLREDLNLNKSGYLVNTIEILLATILLTQMYVGSRKATTFSFSNFWASPNKLKVN